MFLCVFELNQVVAVNLIPNSICLSCLVLRYGGFSKSKFGGVCGSGWGVPGSPYFFCQILSDMDTIFQWHKFKFQNRGK